MTSRDIPGFDEALRASVRSLTTTPAKLNRSAELDGTLNATYNEALATFEAATTQPMERAQGNKTKAAEIAGIDRTVLYPHLKSKR